MWTLLCQDRIYPLSPGRYVLGRGSDCEVRVDDALVSRRHAELLVDDDGVVLRDLGSRNGVLHRYKRVPVDEVVPLSNGETFLVGHTRLVLRRSQSGAHRRTKTVEASLTRPTKMQEGSTARPVMYEKFLDEAKRSLERGDLERCATATHLLLETLSAALGQGLPRDTPSLEGAARLALQLAELRGVEWVDLLLGVYGRHRVVLSVHAITTMQRLFTEKGWRSEELEGYVAHVREALDGRGPRASALLLQLEGLLRRQVTG